MSMTTKSSSDEVSVVLVARSVPFVAGDTPAIREWAEELVARAGAEGVELTGDDGLLTAMMCQVLQTGLEVELSDHLGYEPNDPAGRGSGQPERELSDDGHDRYRSCFAAVELLRVRISWSCCSVGANRLIATIRPGCWG